MKVNRVLIFGTHEDPANPTENSLLIIRNFGCHRIAHVIRSLGYDTEVIDFVTHWDDTSFEQLLNDRIIPGTVIGWSSQFFYTNEFYTKWSTYIKQRFTDVVSIAGGPKALWIKSFTDCDYVVSGYAEYAVPHVLAHIEDQTYDLHYTQIDGCKYIDANDNYKNTALPELYTEYQDRDYILSHEPLTIELGRGCIFKCKYCDFPLLGKTRGDYLRDMDSIYNELSTNYERWGTTEYFLSEETFNDVPYKIELLAEAVSRLPFRPSFTGFARLDLMHSQRNTWDLYEQAGLLSIHFGIESFNKKTAETVGKGMAADMQKQLLIDLRDRFKDKLKVNVSFIVGLPYETEETIIETANWFKNNPVVNGFKYFPLMLNRLSPENRPFQVPSELSLNYLQYGYQSMKDSEIEEQTALWNVNAKPYRNFVMWKNKHFNFLSAIALAKKYEQEVNYSNNTFGVWKTKQNASLGPELLANTTNNYDEFVQHAATIKQLYLTKYINKKLK
jgi:radical SAM superfamily enzyme YgiQ (UPF0313 family)